MTDEEYRDESGEIDDYGNRMFKNTVNSVTGSEIFYRNNINVFSDV